MNLIPRTSDVLQNSSVEDLATKSIITDLFVSIRFLQGIIPESAAKDHLKYFAKNAPFSITDLNVGYVSTKTDDLSVAMLFKYSYNDLLELFSSIGFTILAESDQLEASSAGLTKISCLAAYSFSVKKN